MGYRNLRACVNDLDKQGQLVRIPQEVDPYLEAAAIQRRVYEVGGPALFFERVKGCRFPLVSNLFGTLERTRFLFRDSLETVRQLIELKIDPNEVFKHPWRTLRLLPSLRHLLPKRVKRGPILHAETTIDQLPPLVSWPRDGGPFVLLPQVYSEDVRQPGMMKSNLGMYRIQLAGNHYTTNRQLGMHYQLHRGIGVHHAAAKEAGKPFRVNVFIGGPPVMNVAAVMPLPEGVPELVFAGALGGRRVAMVHGQSPLPFPAEADFVITGTVDPELKLPEGPFGDHLGYYSLMHDYPVLNVERVFHRADAIWPFTSVGRPPQEDTSFGEFIHELTGPILPTVMAGVHAVHAVDAAGVHPLLLAIGSERYTPYAPRRVPQELLTCANALLGQGQLSLAKYLFIVAHEDNPALSIHDIPAFMRHLLERFDPTRDVHFHTRTTIDTLDYTGTGLNEGSKVVLAAVGPSRRQLPTTLPANLTLPEGFTEPQICLPGVLAVQGPPFESGPGGERLLQRWRDLPAEHAANQFPLVVLVDDSEFTACSLNNFLWVTFTRSNPAADVHGVGEFVEQKHWGCRGSLLLDARGKPHHAPPLEDDPAVMRRVEALAAVGGPLHGIL